MHTTRYLTAHEHEQARQRAEKVMLKRLEQRRPDSNDYEIEAGKSLRLINATLLWSKAFIPVVALLAALASSIRTVQAVSEIYTASGSHPIGVVLAAIAFTLSTEGALFVLALAQEGESLKLKMANQPRHVASLNGLWRGIQVRVGLRAPLSLDEMPEKTDLGTVMVIAFTFAVAANAYMGLRPLLQEVGAVSLQQVLTSLWSAPATMQMTFIVDCAGILFPPLMALSAGHLTARFAAEVAEQLQTNLDDYDDDLKAWRAACADPLATEEGQAVLALHLNDKRHRKATQTAHKPNAVDFLAHNTAENGRQGS